MSEQMETDSKSLWNDSELLLEKIYNTLKDSANLSDDEVPTEFLDSLSDSAKESMIFVNKVLAYPNKDSLKMNQACADRLTMFINMTEKLPRNKDAILSGRVIIDDYLSLLTTILPVVLYVNETLN